jgi:hypothetical protein
MITHLLNRLYGTHRRLWFVVVFSIASAWALLVAGLLVAGVLLTLTLIGA